jgi:hypothetical protein
MLIATSCGKAIATSNRNVLLPPIVGNRDVIRTRLRATSPERTQVYSKEKFLPFGDVTINRNVKWDRNRNFKWDSNRNVLLPPIVGNRDVTRTRLRATSPERTQV